jgi:hypothetical protein
MVSFLISAIMYDCLKLYADVNKSCHTLSIHSDISAPILDNSLCGTGQWQSSGDPVKKDALESSFVIEDATCLLWLLSLQANEGKVAVTA